jgi:hypothetical protein
MTYGYAIPFALASPAQHLFLYDYMSSEHGSKPLFIMIYQSIKTHGPIMINWLRFLIISVLEFIKNIP